MNARNQIFFFRDQRITQDVERMTNKLAINIVPNLIIGPFVIAYYTYKTASTYGFFFSLFYSFVYFVLEVLLFIIISHLWQSNNQIKQLFIEVFEVLTLKFRLSCGKSVERV